MFYLAMGNPPDTSAALVIMAEALASRADPNLVNAALNRCMTECRYPVRLPDIFSRIPGFDVDVNAEKRLAWETVMRFVRKYVGNDVHGNFGPEHGWYPNNFPELSARLLDTVRRTGGWSIYARMGDEDLPFVQKRFFEEYQAWTEIQHVAADPAKVLEMPRRKELTGTQAIQEPAPEKPAANPGAAGLLEQAPVIVRRFPPVQPPYRDLNPYEVAERRQRAKEAFAQYIERQIAAASDPAQVEHLQKKLEKIRTPDPAMAEGARKLAEQVEKLKANEGDVA